MSRLLPFTNWVDGLTVPGLPEGYCGSYWAQDYFFNDDGTWQFRMGMIFQCSLDWLIREETVTFDLSTYENLEFFYETYDQDGNVVNTTVETCFEPVDGKISCVYELGYQADYASLGATQGWQLRAGFQFPVYTNPNVSVSGRWVY